MKSVGGIQDTHLRYLAMLQVMPVGRWLAVDAIRERLIARGFGEISRRTIQRDLWKLSEQFGLESMEVCGRGRPHVWRRTRSLEVWHGQHAREAA